MSTQNLQNSQNETIPDDLAWAKDVMSVWRQWGKPIIDCTFETPSAQALHSWATNPENAEKFVSMMAPKATEIIQKHKKESPDNDEIAYSERKNIAELQELIKEAIEKSSNKFPVHA